MASFIYFYSKFTEEFLLLSAAGVFALSSVYCYTWVVKKRRLGAARDQVPAGMVKVYLNQLINEAQFVRTQLFGLVGSANGANADPFAAHFQAASPSSHALSPSTSAAPAGEVPSELFERMKALETQLAEKEGMVVNINVEKTKLLEEIENLKQNEKAVAAAPASVAGNNDDLVNKIKALEERLEEYALFEDDLANLKRLQQENNQLKQQIEAGAGAMAAATPAAAPAPAPAALSAVPAPEPELAPTTPVAAKAEPEVAPTLKAVPSPAQEAEAEAKKEKEKNSLLDQDAVNALLDGVSAVPPTPALSTETIAAAPEALPTEAIESLAAAVATPATTTDEFENLVDSIENSLTPAPQEAKTETVVSEQDARTLEASIEASLDSPMETPKALAEKSDEELLKEFENLLNS